MNVDAHHTANNGDNINYSDSLPMAFTKGLQHDPKTGFVASPEQFQKFVNALTQPKDGNETDRAFDVDRLAVKYVEPTPMDDRRDDFRSWESPLAGMAYENQGVDPDDANMAPAPKLGESELCAEMAEVYAMALIRDMPFSYLSNGSNKLQYFNAQTGAHEDFVIDEGGVQRPATVDDLIASLNSLNWFKSPDRVTTSLSPSASISMLECRRQKARGKNSPVLSVDTLFRGSSPGCKFGPYISQFLLQGAGGKGVGSVAADAGKTDEQKALNEAKGGVSFGAQSISQKVYTNEPGIDWMTNWRDWLAVQEGIDVAGLDRATGQDRLITTPRDLATYVHIDQLYQAYFVACLMLLNKSVKGDPGFPERNSSGTRTAFATFGGPHILSQMTEVASRALRAVRRQKFQIHRRARPEVLAQRIALGASRGSDLSDFGSAAPKMRSMLNELGVPDTPKEITQILTWIDHLNSVRNSGGDLTTPTKAGLDLNEADPPVDPIVEGKNYLLPMAFPEGSPMHPAYGAGHATVAGACVTILKAFFDIYHDAPKAGHEFNGGLTAKLMSDAGLGLIVEPTANGSFNEVSSQLNVSLTIEGELNKLAANIAIGRNFAGVHYYTDYYDSLRMGERVAVAMLEEHLFAHPEPVAMHFRSFDEESIRLATDGSGSVTREIWSKNGALISPETWWNKDVAEFPERPESSTPAASADAIANAADGASSSLPG